jgi:tRNA(fMet)-specific endonuclease VapC
MVVLDTDHVSFLERAGSPEGQRLRARLNAPGVEEAATTVISYEGQLRGWLTSLAKAKSMAQQITAYRRLRAQLENYCQIVVLEFEETAATVFQRLQKAKLRIGTLDLKIAAITLAHDATLLTRNLADFRRVPNLRIEDWTT